MSEEKNYCDVHFDTEMVDVGNHGVEEFVCPECFKEVKELRTRVAEIEKALTYEESLYSQKKMECQLMDIERAKLLKASEGMEKALEINLPMLRAFHLDYTGGPTDENGNRPDQPIYKHENCGTCDDLIYGERILADFRAVKEGL